MEKLCARPLLGIVLRRSNLLRTGLRAGSARKKEEKTGEASVVWVCIINSALVCLPNDIIDSRSSQQRRRLRHACGVQPNDRQELNAN